MYQFYIYFCSKLNMEEINRKSHNHTENIQIGDKNDEINQGKTNENLNDTEIVCEVPNL